MLTLLLLVSLTVLCKPGPLACPICAFLWVLLWRKAVCCVPWLCAVSMGEAQCVFAWLPKQWREVWLPVPRTHPQSQMWISSSGLYAGSAQLVKAGTDRRCTDRGNVISPSFCLHCFSPFFPLFWHWHMSDASTSISLIYTWVFCSYENLWLRHNCG